MDSRKIILSCHLATSALAWFLTRSFIYWLVLSFYQVRRLPGIQATREVLPVVVAAAVFITLWKNARVNLVLEEVVAELKRVTWPSVEDVRKSTIVVMVCIVLISGILALFDLLFGKMMSYLLS